jgi:hypothetical protein
VVLYVASDLNPTLRSWLLVIVAIPAVSQFTLLILDTSLVKGWRADRSEEALTSSVETTHGGL